MSMSDRAVYQQLSQDKQWRGGHGPSQAIDQMDAWHALNVMRLLEKNTAILSWCHTARPLIYMTPIEALRATPLMIALQQAAARPDPYAPKSSSRAISCR